MMRYVVLRHEGVTDPHFDLMLEREEGGVLATWRTPVWPLENKTELTSLPDHRRDYLTYEGPLSAGRGHVSRVAQGTFEWVKQGLTICIVHFLEPSDEEWLIGGHRENGMIAVRVGD